MRQNKRNAKVGVGARLGQHFLQAPWAARALARAANPANDETVLEIGPGKGALTRELLAVSRKVVAIEKDEELVKLLNEKFSNEIRSGALTIHSADIRDVNPKTLHLVSGKYIVAANIPYYITGEIIRQFLTAARQPRAMALLVQKEVARRIVAKKPAGGGSSSGGKESLLSLSVKAYGTPKIVVKVPRGNFSPPPNVDSAIILIDNISRDFFSPVKSQSDHWASADEELFFKILHAGFKSKRKFLLSNLAGSFDKEKVSEAFAQCEINPKARAEDVSLPQWRCIAGQLLASSV